MHPVSEADDVERLLDVLGVPTLPYLRFPKSINAQPSRPIGSETHIESAFPLLAAALPELAGATVPRTTDKTPATVTEAPALSGHVPVVAAPPEVTPPEGTPPDVMPREVMPAPRQAAPVFRQPVNPPSPPPTASHAPETPIRGVFSILRGTPLRRESATPNQPGIRNLFHRP